MPFMWENVPFVIGYPIPLFPQALSELEAEKKTPRSQSEAAQWITHWETISEYCSLNGLLGCIVVLQWLIMYGYPIMAGSVFVLSVLIPSL